ncbi:MAG: hypothetical protein ACC682_16145 [Gemmatimonadota bacterium]
MSFFEYVMVIAAILMGISFAQLMRGASDIVRTRAYDGVHFTWLVALAVVHLQFWWSFWDLESLPQEAWNAGKFVYFVLGPAILYFTTNVLTPQPGPADDDWSGHMRRIRVPLLTMLIVLGLWIAGMSALLLGVGPIHPTRATQLIVIAICAGGLALPGRRAQQVVAGLFLLVIIANWFLVRWTPGLLAG